MLSIEGEMIVGVERRAAMSKGQRNTSRKPATEFSHLRKKLDRNRIRAKKIGKKK